MNEMNFEACKAADEKYIAHTYKRFPICLVRGEGSFLWDADGKKYLDFTSGIGVNALGHAHPGLLKAWREQMNMLSHTSNLYYTKESVRFAERISTLSKMKRLFFCNSGTEANEGAIKAARKYAYQKYRGERSRILTLKNSFHGRTLLSLSATGQESFHIPDYAPWPGGFSYTPPGDINALEKNCTDDVLALMMETIQGEGGVHPLERDFLRKAADICREKDILLIIDEVQTGMGRTGRLFSYGEAGILPDIVTIAKGVGAGIPMGAVLLGEKCADIFIPGDHGSTFGGNLLALSGANFLLDILTPEFLREVREKGEYLKNRLAALSGIESVSGRGLMLGATPKQKNAAFVIHSCMQKGLLLLSAKDRIRFLPPLTITKEELDAGMEILESVL